MSFHLATKTLAAIDAALEADQGSAFRMWLGRILPHMKDAYRQDEDGLRTHLGASIVGGECARQIWYSFRWAKQPKFDGKTLRLFNRGHLEEARFLALLAMIDVDVYQQDAEGNQFRISHADGHMGGSGDGWGIKLPDLPSDVRFLLECKTHGEKSYLKLVKDGVRVAKPEHYVQMCTYMRKMSIPIGLYAAVNKNTDHLHLEIVAADDSTADQYLERGLRIVAANDPPKRVSTSPGYFGCIFCDFKQICHFKAPMDKNCRTCKFSEPTANNTWTCKNWQIVLDKEAQIKGCERYEAKDNT